MPWLTLFLTACSPTLTATAKIIRPEKRIPNHTYITPFINACSMYCRFHSPLSNFAMSALSVIIKRKHLAMHTSANATTPAAMISKLFVSHTGTQTALIIVVGGPISSWGTTRPVLSTHWRWNIKSSAFLSGNMDKMRSIALLMDAGLSRSERRVISCLDNSWSIVIVLNASKHVLN